MKYVIDRIEGVTAVCEDENGVMRNLPLKVLYEDAKEGDHFAEEAGSYLFDPGATEKARRKAVLLQGILFEDN